MIPDVETTCKEILAEIRSISFSTPSSVNELFFSAERLRGHLAYLGGPKLDAEQLYRQKILYHIEDGMSVAKAEAYAKAGKKYKDWKKIEMVFNSAESQILLLKKFKEDLAMEFNQS